MARLRSMEKFKITAPLVGYLMQSGRVSSGEQRIAQRLDEAGCRTRDCGQDGRAIFPPAAILRPRRRPSQRSTPADRTGRRRPAVRRSGSDPQGQHFSASRRAWVRRTMRARAAVPRVLSALCSSDGKEIGRTDRPGSVDRKTCRHCSPCRRSSRRIRRATNGRETSSLQARSRRR